jgi:hypothetical protein
MVNNNIQKNSLFLKIIEKSTFTNRQIQIIHNIYNRENRPKGISSGAYYREVKQCKAKIRRLYYSIIILGLMDIINNEQLITLNLAVERLYKLKDNSQDIHHDISISSVIGIIEQMLDKMILL